MKKNGSEGTNSKFIFLKWATVWFLRIFLSKFGAFSNTSSSTKKIVGRNPNNSSKHNFLCRNQILRTSKTKLRSLGLAMQRLLCPLEKKVNFIIDPIFSNKRKRYQPAACRI
jgi:hypothetical protein